MPGIEDGVFHHPCAKKGCNRTVIFDDEAFCTSHASDRAHIEGYSARAKAAFAGEENQVEDARLSELK